LNNEQLKLRAFVFKSGDSLSVEREEAEKEVRGKENKGEKKNFPKTGKGAVQTLRKKVSPPFSKSKNVNKKCRQS